ncbi:MAG: cystathionine gamma-lyase Cth [Rhodobacteraceae bacterium HLUCCA08]|nr:MAG: cystathionine gamma-lyase Cth [Rhodobacteraceae bacterium HLUCCA08]
MSDQTRAARLLHLRAETLQKGDPVALPLTLASMYHLPGDPAGVPGYGRMDNATVEALEHALALLEDAPCLAFPSGMAAISAALFATLKAGDRLLIPSDGYYTTRLLADRFLARLGVTVDTRPTASFAEGGLAGYAVVFLETPSNPGLDLCDLSAICAEIRAAGGVSIVDNTTMTPFGQRPLDLGADIVVASDTKAPNGHSDALMGHVATRDDNLLEELRAWRKLGGGIPGPFEAWLTHRGLETLELRFARMCDSAEALAPRLADHPRVARLRYPGLPGDPAHNLARRQMARPGLLIGLELDSAETAERFIDTCPLLQPATSFGGVHSSAERRARWGDAVAPGFVRLSVGIEPVEPLWAALKESLDAL